MPEGPEIYKASVLVNTVCAGRLFSGNIVKSSVNWKNPEIPFSAPQYTIVGKSRGKELMLTLRKVEEDASLKIALGTSENSLLDKSSDGSLIKSEECDEKVIEKNDEVNILFRFGMSGKFMFTTEDEIHKHAHLMFFTKEEPKYVLSFVDVRRFGRWEISKDWSPGRSPDPLLDYQRFRKHVLSSLKKSAFSKPICEVLNNQEYFNGIGNYLRAEILFRANVQPFEVARKVLEPLQIKGEDEKAPDFLDLCHIVPSEVIKLPGAGYDPEGNHSDYSVFNNWLQCYYNPEMKNLVDGNGRTIWFRGSPGPLAPKVKKSRGIKKTRKRQEGKSEETEYDLSPKGKKPRKQDYAETSKIERKGKGKQKRILRKDRSQRTGKSGPRKGKVQSNTVTEKTAAIITQPTNNNRKSKTKIIGKQVETKITTRKLQAKAITKKVQLKAATTKVQIETKIRKRQSGHPIKKTPANKTTSRHQCNNLSGTDNVKITPNPTRQSARIKRRNAGEEC